VRRLDSMKIEPKVEENEFSRCQMRIAIRRWKSLFRNSISKSDSRHKLLMTIKFRRSLGVRIKDYIPKKNWCLVPYELV